MALPRPTADCHPIRAPDRSGSRIPRIFAHALDAARTLPGRCLVCTEEPAHALACQEIGLCSISLRPGMIRVLAAALPPA
jgi:hypothetical protein